MPRTSQIIELKVHLPMWLSEARRTFLEYWLKENVRSLDKGHVLVGPWTFMNGHEVPTMVFSAPIADTGMLIDGAPWLVELASKFFYELFACEGYDGNVVNRIRFFVTTDDEKERKIDYEYRKVDHTIKRTFYEPSDICR